jgi:hypothetical protein
LNAANGTDANSLITFGGNWDATGGTFTKTNSTAMFEGTSTTATLTSGGQSFNNLTINDGLVAYWKFDETSAGSFTDASGYGYTGTGTGAGGSNNTPQPNTSVPTVNFADARSLSFDGTDDYVSTAYTSAIGTSEFSYAAWVKTSTAATIGSIIGKRLGSGTFMQFSFYISGNASGTASGTLLGFGDRDGTNNRLGVSTVTVADGNWHHVALVRSSDATRLYIDGVLNVTSNLTSMPNLTRTDPIFIGNLGNGGAAAGSAYLNGSLDDVRIYNRALTAAEIARLAAGNQPQTSTGRITLEDALDVDGNLTLNSGALDTKSGENNAITLAGNWESSGGVFTARSGTVTMDAGAAGKTVLAGGNTFYALTFNNGSGGWTLNDNLEAYDAVTLTAGTVTHPTSRDETLVTVGSSTDANFVVSGGTFTGVASSFAIEGDLEISSGTFTAPSEILTVSEDFNRSGGTFTHSSGTARFNGTGGGTLTSGGQTFNNVTIGDGLIGYWKFDETAANSCSGGSNDACDSSGLGLDATWNGDAAASTALPPVPYSNIRSLTFDGTGDYVQVPDTSNILDVAHITMSAWVKKAADLSNYGIVIGRQYDTSNQDAYILAYNNSASDEYFCIIRTSGGQDNTAATPVSTADVGAWVHLACTYDGTTIRMYKNGVELTNKTHAYGGDIVSESTSVSIGGGFNGSGRDVGPSEYFNGQMDDVRIYNRALSADEIAALSKSKALGTSAGSVTLSGNLDANGDMRLGIGTFLPGATTVNVGGSWTNTGATLTAGTSTVIFDGTSGSKTLRESGSFYNMTLNDGGGTMTMSLSRALDVNNDLTITGGTLDVTTGNYGITVGHDWSNSDTFTPRSGTVTFDGTTAQTVTSGSSSYYGLTVTNSSANVTFTDAFTTTNFTAITPSTDLKFQNSATYVISGILNMRGSLGNNVTVNTDDGIAPAFTFNVTGGEQLGTTYVTVANSNASSNNIVATRSTDGGGTDSAAAAPHWELFAGSHPLYRSIGTSTSNLNTSNHTVTIAGSTATFSGAMPDNVGVGDVLQYNPGSGLTVAFITGRTSSTVYTIKSRFGAEPTAAAGGTAVSVFRAFNSLINWETQNVGNVNSGINDSVDDLVLYNSTDLSADGFAVYVAGYADGADASGTTTIGAEWVTDANNFMRIYTPVTASEVGASQRHSGTWSTSAYRLTPIYIAVRTGYLRLDGLQMEVVSTSTFTEAVETFDEALDLEISNSIIKASFSGAADNNNGIHTRFSGSGSREIRIWNNIIYDFSNGAATGIRAININSTWTAYIYNNTIHNSYYGMGQVTGGTVVAKNNIVNDTTDPYFGTFTTSTNNVGDVAGDVPGSNPRKCSVSFSNEAGDDFRLATSDTCALNAGTDLSADAEIAVTTDIVATARPAATTFDIGAYEVSDPATINQYRSVGTTATELLADGGTTTVTIADGTATFSAAVPSAIGVGDVLVYADEAGGAHLAFITARTSSTVFSVRDKNGREPPYANANAVDVFRSYASLANWESQTENANVTEPTENDINPSTDLVTADYIFNTACYADGADTTNVIINGWTTGSSNYMKIYTPVSTSEVGTSQRHSGAWSTSAYRLVVAGATDAIQVEEGNVRLEGLQIEEDTTLDGHDAIELGAAETVDYRVSHNIIREASADGNNLVAGIAIDGDILGGDVRVWNNIIYDFNDTDDACISMGDNQSDLHAYNNTCQNAYIAYHNTSFSGDFISKNNITQDHVSDGFNGTFHANSTNNISDSAADAPGTSPNSCEVQFRDVGNDDFRLAGQDSCANDYGTDLSADANLAFSDDIAGTTRTNWDAGAHEPTGGGNTDGISLGTNF